MRTGKTRRTGYGHLSDAVQAMFDHFNSLSTSDLRKAWKASCKLTTSNCGWATYAARDLAKEMIDGILHTRRFLARKERKEAAHV